MELWMFTSPLKRKVIETNETELLSYFKNQPLIYQLIKKYPNMKRVVYQDAFVLLLDTIISQQISTQAKDHIMQRLEKSFKAITPVTISVSTTESLRAFGIPKQKANTIINIANDCVEGKLDLDGLKNQSEKEIIETLIAYKGIGIWTCEMMLLFAYEKTDVLSYHDYGIRKGLEILFDIEKINSIQFNEFSKKISPYGSELSLYIWELAKRP